MSVVIGCYNCAETEGGPICDGCWRQIKKEKERCERSERRKRFDERVIPCSLSRGPFAVARCIRQAEPRTRDLHTVRDLRPPERLEV